MPQPFYGTPPSWVLTRLHARYSKETLSEDLIFREAKPAMGGRANWNGTNGDEGAQRQPTDQRRQQLPGALHHPPLLERAGRLRGARATTTGAGRPATVGGAAPTAAKGLATAPRGKIVLKSGGALAGAAARHRGQAAAATARRSDEAK